MKRQWSVESKAAQIRRLYADGLTPPEIAKIVGCGQSYVRVCARQRLDGAPSMSDTRYRVGKFGSVRAFYKHHNEQSREYRIQYYRRRRAALKSGAWQP